MRALARRLGDELQRIPSVRLLHPVEASGVFAEMPDRYHEGLKDRGWRYYQFIGGGARLMCSWKTTEADVAELVRDLREVAAAS
jgi:threonine aldolase